MSLKPYAVLVSHTDKAAYLMREIVRFSTNEVQEISLDSADAFESDSPAGRQALADLEKYAWSQVAEMVHFTFVFHNIPSALLQQLARHRHLSLFVRSARVYRDPDWASKGNFFQPDTLIDPHGIYERTMLKIQEATNELFLQGNSVEDVRGLMPAHSLYEMVVCFSLRTLADTVRKRTCEMLQQELWRPLLQSMRAQLEAKVSPALGKLFCAPCESNGGNCVHEEEVLRRFRGEVPLQVCGRWAKRNNVSEV